MDTDPGMVLPATLPTPCLHCYASGGPHDEVFLIGERAAWQALAAAIAALLDGHPSAPLVYAADGEGYHLYLDLWSADDPRWAQVRLPYAEEWRPGVHPAALIRLPPATAAWRCAGCGHAWTAPAGPAPVACPQCPAVGLVAPAPPSPGPTSPW